MIVCNRETLKYDPCIHWNVNHLLAAKNQFSLRSHLLDFLSLLIEREIISNVYLHSLVAAGRYRARNR